MIDLLIVLAGPVILGTGLYAGDRFVTWFGVFYTALFVVAHFLRRHNRQKALSKVRLRQNQLVEQFADEQQGHSDRDISR